MDQQFNGLRHLKKLVLKSSQTKNFIREINKSLIFNKDSSVIALTPSNKTTIISTISFSYKAIGNQTYVIDLNPKCFVENIAPQGHLVLRTNFKS